MNLFTPLGHDDPLFAVQPAASEWHLDELHVLSVGRGVRVAVVDSGVQTDHPDLSSQVAESANLIDRRQDVAELHGTAVAGVIAAQADNHLGIVGVAPQVRLLALRACAESTPVDTRCTTLGLALALQRALERDAQVINLSLGGPSDRLIRSLIEVGARPRRRNRRRGKRSEARGGFPADLPGVVGVIDAVDGGHRAACSPRPGPTCPPRCRTRDGDGVGKLVCRRPCERVARIDDRHADAARGRSASLAEDLVVRPIGASTPARASCERAAPEHPHAGPRRRSCRRPGHDPKAGGLRNVGDRSMSAAMRAGPSSWHPKDPERGIDGPDASRLPSP
jgi:hypothetical protein